MENEFKNLVESSEKILVTSHISPDPDAVCALLLTAETLKLNYPDKDISAVLEEHPDRDLSFLEGYSRIIFAPLEGSVARTELVIIVDANKFERVSRGGWQKIRGLVSDNGIKTAVVDHHEESDKDNVHVFINSRAPAAVEEVYHLLFDKLRLSKPLGYADITMLGLVSDTARFKYHNPNYRQTFALVSDLLDAGVDIERLENRLSRYTPEQLEVVEHLLANAVSDAGYNYSYITDAFAAKWLNDSKSIADYRGGCDIFSSHYIRNIGDNFWGFVVYPDLAGGPGSYALSLRSVHGVKDVSELAGSMGGGGHKSAAGAKLTKNSIESALNEIRQAIKQSA